MGIGLDWTTFYLSNFMQITRFWWHVNNPKHLQDMIDLLIALFDRVPRHKTSSLKTELVILFPARVGTCLPKEAYHTMIDPSTRGAVASLPDGACAVPYTYVL